MLHKRFSWQGYAFFSENSMSPWIRSHKTRTQHSLTTYQKESTPGSSQQCNWFCPSLSSITSCLSPMHPLTFIQLPSARGEKPTCFIHHHQRQPDCWSHQQKLPEELCEKQGRPHRAPANSYFCTSQKDVAALASPKLASSTPKSNSDF